MTDNAATEAIEDLLNKVDYEGGWDGFFLYGFDPESYPDVPARVLDDISLLREKYRDYDEDVQIFESELLEEYGVSL